MILFWICSGFKASAVLPTIPWRLLASSGICLYSCHATLFAHLHHDLHHPPQVNNCHFRTFLYSLILKMLWTSVLKVMYSTMYSMHESHHHSLHLSATAFLHGITAVWNVIELLCKKKKKRKSNNVRKHLKLLWLLDSRLEIRVHFHLRE